MEIDELYGILISFIKWKVIIMILWILIVLALLLLLRMAWKRLRPISFKGKTIWITGASSGIGEGLAEEFHSLGAFVILSGRNEAELLRVHSLMPNSMIFSFDLSDSSKVIERAQVLLSNQRVDILINNAGVSQRSFFIRNLETIRPERTLMEVNYLSVIALTKAFVKHLSGRRGTVAVVSSTAGLLPSIGSSGYSGSKSGIINYFQAMSAELRDLGVSVVNLAPGYTDTRLSLNALNEKGEKSGFYDPRNANGIKCQDFAKIAARRIFNGDKEIIITQTLDFLPYFVLKSVAPRVSTWIVKKLMKTNAENIIKKRN
jgi:short-subunit dehydrogenase